MKIMLRLLAGVPAIALLSVPAVWAQSVYSTPRAFATIAGKAWNAGPANGTNSDARFYFPYGIAADTHSNLYVADGYENTIRMLAPLGTNWVVTTIAGTPGVSSGDADGTNGAAVFDVPVGIAVDANSNLFVGEYGGSTIRKITPSGTNWVVTTIAGQPRNYDFADGTNGGALFNGQLNLTVDANGNLYVADTYNYVIRKIAPVGTNWVVTTIAGQPDQFGNADGTNGGASFGYPYGLAFDRSGNLFVSDDDATIFGGATIRKLTPAGTNWVVATIAGSPTVTGSADGTNNAALFNYPLSVTADNSGNLFVADSGDFTIRKVAADGTNWVVSTIAGVAGVSGSSDGTGTNALFAQPWGATVDSAGNLFVTDAGSSTIRMGLAPVTPPATNVPNPVIQFIVPATIQISWPNTGSFTLQTNADLATANWGNYGGTINTDGVTNSAAFAPMQGRLFFRLRQ